MISRRTLLRLGATSVAAGVGLYTWRVEPRWLEMVRRPLPIRGLPQRLAGRTLVHLSDVHVGTRVDDDYVLTTFRRVAELRPDIVVVTGDFVSHHAEIFEHVRRIYQHFPKGRLATLATLGNHDYGPAWAHPEIAQRISDDVRACGIDVLRNEIRDVDGLQVAGLDDLWANRFAPEDALPKLDHVAPRSC